MRIASYRWAPLLLLLSLVFAPRPSHAEDPAAPKTGMPAATHDAQFVAMLDMAFRYLDRGYMIEFGLDSTFEVGPSRARVFLYDREGRVAREPIVWIDGARRVYVEDVAVSPSGTVVVAGATLDGELVPHSFIGEIGSDDHLKTVLPVEPFVPSFVCAMDDGTVWAYGHDRDEIVKKLTSPRLRHFSLEKGQLQAMLDPAKLPSEEPLSESWTPSRGRYPGEITLRCNSKSVVLYNAASGDLVEVDPRNNAMRITKVPLFPGPREFRITGSALTESGEIFVSVWDHRNPKSYVWGLFRLERDSDTTAKWVPVPGAQGAVGRSTFYMLLGSDGNDLVYAKDKSGRLYWSRPD